MLMSLQIAVKTFIRIICIVWICGEEKKIKFGKAAINGQTRTPISLDVDLVLSQYSGHRKCDFYAAPSA